MMTTTATEYQVAAKVRANGYLRMILDTIYQKIALPQTADALHTEIVTK